MKKIYSLFLSMFALSAAVHANPGDTTWVQANNVQLSNYASNYDTPVTFPNGSVSYRKILMVCTIGEYACPSGSQYCHQWDYTVLNSIITPAGDTFELTRLITPFANAGWSRFPTTWTQPYVFDVTDFYPYLKNNAISRIFFSGYSGGFTANIKYAFIEGTPDRNVIKAQRLYSGYFNYGNATDPINGHLPVKNLTAPAGTVSASLKALLTGHGSDNNGCCEFAAHTYDVVLNGTTLTTKNLWRDNCGLNPLYPQGGTWVYDRSNWCPGALVNPIYHALPGITANGSYTVDLKFANYTVDSDFGGYQTEVAVIYYGAMNKTLDASLNDIAAPTSFPDHFRQNPSNDKPVITVHNSGSTAITSLLLQYGVKDSASQQYTWNGTLAPLADTTITLPATTALANLAKSGATGTHTFVAQILKVNGQTDNDPTNDTLKSTFVSAPVWPSDIVVNFQSGNLGADGNSTSTTTAQGSWVLTDMNNNIIDSRVGAHVNTTFNDTIGLPAAGFYKLTINSLACMGLHWWPYDGVAQVNPGALIVKTTNGTQIPMNAYTYAGTNLRDQGEHDDFGCQYVQYFYVGSASTAISNVDAGYKWMVYPNPASQFITIEISGLADLKMAHIALVNVVGQTVYTTESRQQKVTINTSSYPAGVYTLTYDNGTGKRVEKVVISK